MLGRVPKTFHPQAPREVSYYCCYYISSELVRFEFLLLSMLGAQHGENVFWTLESQLWESISLCNYGITIMRVNFSLHIDFK